MAESDSLFERCWWMYALCRERLFTDHTDIIAASVRLIDRPGDRARLLEIGCGPGFYSRRLAAIFPQFDIVGIDTSERLLALARQYAERERLVNCRFLRADVQDLEMLRERSDVAIVSRFFLVMSDPGAVLRAIFQALRPGGVLFVAEPTSAVRALTPLCVMRALAPLLGTSGRPVSTVDGHVLSEEGFRRLMDSQPWGQLRIWKDARYQYAHCLKAA